MDKKTQNNIKQLNLAVRAQVRNTSTAQQRQQSGMNGFNPAEVFVAEVLDPTAYGVQIVPTGFVLCRAVSGANFSPIDELRFFARLPDSSTSYAFGTYVFILNSEQHKLLVMSAVSGGLGSDTVMMPQHSHSGYYDGGFAPGLSGGQ